MESMPRALVDRQQDFAKSLIRLFAVEELDKKQKLAMTRLWVLAETQIKLEGGGDETTLSKLEEKLKRTEEGKQLLESRFLSPLKDLIREDPTSTREALGKYIIKKGLVK